MGRGFLIIALLQCTIVWCVSPLDVQVDCQRSPQRRMSVYIPRAKLRDGGSMLFRMVDPQCISNKNSTHVQIHTSLDGCDTVVTPEKGGLRYANKISAYMAHQPCPFLQVQFSCLYPHVPIQDAFNDQILVSCAYDIGPVIHAKVEQPAERERGFPEENKVPVINQPPRQVVTRSLKVKQPTEACSLLIGVDEVTREVGIQGEAQQVIAVKRGGKKCKEVRGEGKFDTTLKMYTDHTFKRPYLKKDEQRDEHYFQQHRDVFYELKFQSQQKDLVMAPLTCYATPDANPENLLRYTYFENGCPVDETMILYPTKDSDNTRRFSITSFKFQGTESSAMYSHCKVAVCYKDGDMDDCVPKQCRSVHSGLLRFRRSIDSNIYRPSTYNTFRNPLLRKLSKVKSEVECDRDSMSLTITKPLPSWLKDYELHLQDSGCRATQNATHVMIRTPLDQCGTTMKQSVTGDFVYRNVVLQTKENFPIYRRGAYNQRFTCRYSQRPKGTIGVMTRSSRPVKQFRNNAFGSYNVSIDLFTDLQYTSKSSDSYAEVDSNAPMYFQVEISSNIYHLGLFLDECFGMPLYRTSAHQRFSFIKHGCGVDTSLKFYPTEATNQIRFSVMPFNFGDGRSSDILINCFVTACDGNDLMPNKCTRGCVE